MMVGNIEYGTWKNGASIYKDNKGYYIIDIDNNGKEYKKYIKIKSTVKAELFLDKKKWSNKNPKNKKTKKTKKKKRPSPSYPANDYCGKKKRGNDGNMYISKKNKNGICRWIKLK